METKKEISNKQFLLIAFAIFMAAIAVVVIYMWRNKFTISETGTLGDGFNGFLTPLISFGAALLIYYSFKEQIKANELLQKQWLNDSYLRSFKEIESTYKAIQVTRYYTGGSEIFKGEIAIQKIIEFLGNKPTLRLEGVDTALKELEITVMELLYLMQALYPLKAEENYYIYFKVANYYNLNMSETLNRFMLQREAQNSEIDSLTVLIKSTQKMMEGLDSKFTNDLPFTNS